MFARLTRVLKSWIGYFISFAEDPEVMLQESIEEMRNTLPRLNQILVTTRATVIRLEQEKTELERRSIQLTSSIQAALQEGSPEARKIAEADALALQEVRQDLTATLEQFEAASKAFDNAQKKAFFDILYAQTVGSATPLREALSRAGRYFAYKRNGINNVINGDPME